MVTMNLTNTQTGSNVTDASSLMEKLKFLEEQREKSFKYWQYSEIDNCSKKKVCLSIYNNFQCNIKQLNN